MAYINVYRLKETNSNVAELFYAHSTKANNSKTYIITKCNINVYATATNAKSRSVSNTDKDAMMMIKPNTAAKILAVNSSGGSIVACIQCGNKQGWIYIGRVRVSANSGKPSYSWSSGPFTNFAYRNYSAHEFSSALGLGVDDVYRNTSSYENLNNNNEINTERLVSGVSVNTAGAKTTPSEETSEKVENTTTDASSNSSTTSTASNVTNAASSDVTNKFSIKVNPSYAYNIADHLDGIKTGEDYIANGDVKPIDYSKLRYIFGLPYQFLPTTDCRVSDNYSDNLEVVGYEFADKIISRLNFLYITPGNTSFMGGSSNNARTALLGSLSTKIENVQSGAGDLTETSLETMLSEYNGKLYTIMPAYKEYFSYVNPLCRAGAIFLNIGSSTFEKPGNNTLVSNGTTFENMNWGINEGVAYDIWKEEEDTEDEEVEDDTETPETTNESTETEKQKFEEDYSDYFKVDSGSVITSFEKNLYYGNAIAFYINSDSSFQDSFGNETTESLLSSTINTLSDKAREMQFLLGTSRQMVGEALDKVDGTLSDIKSQINTIVEKISGGNSIFTTIANSVKTIVSGGRMLFPQIWSNSSFSKSYNISIKLNCPSTDRISWWLNIYVPLCHLMALVLPRSEYVNSYTTPFIIKAFYKGMFNIDMGIIKDMSFNKGKEGSWTKDGLPTVVDVSFTIEDLYANIGITSTEKMFKGKTLQNVAEMDYIANLCGININEPDVFRMVKLWCAFNITNRVYDFIPNLSLSIGKYIDNKIINAYNNFWF